MDENYQNGTREVKRETELTGRERHEYLLLLPLL